jgi:hypothetical protein
MRLGEKAVGRWRVVEQKCSNFEVSEELSGALMGTRMDADECGHGYGCGGDSNAGAFVDMPASPPIAQRELST